MFCNNATILFQLAVAWSKHGVAIHVYSLYSGCRQVFEENGRDIGPTAGAYVLLYIIITICLLIGYLCAYS